MGIALVAIAIIVVAYIIFLVSIKSEGVEEIVKYDLEGAMPYEVPSMLKGIVHRFKRHFRPMNGDKYLITITRVNK